MGNICHFVVGVYSQLFRLTVANAISILAISSEFSSLPCTQINDFDRKTTEALCLRDLLLVLTWFKNGTSMKGKCPTRGRSIHYSKSDRSWRITTPASSPSRGKQWRPSLHSRQSTPVGLSSSCLYLLVSWWFTSCWLPSLSCIISHSYIGAYWHHLPNKLCAQNLLPVCLPGYAT